MNKVIGAVKFAIEFAQELSRIEAKARRRKQMDKIRRYYRNQRLYGCGCCDGPPAWPL
jgi:hypothetical protein